MLNIPVARLVSLMILLLLAVTAWGCTSGKCSTEAGYVGGAAASCSTSLAPGTEATINVPVAWCGCGVTPSCAVDVSQGGIQLILSVEICPITVAAPCACLEAPCTLTTPGAGIYTLTFPTGPGTTGQSQVTVDSGGATSCNL